VQIKALVHEVVSSWQSLAADWQLEAAEHLYEQLEYLADLAANLSLENLRQPVLDFCAYLSSFVETQPSPQHLAVMGAMVQKLEAALRKPSARLEPASVLALSPPRAEWHAAFRMEGIDLGFTASASGLLDALNSRTIQLVICPLKLFVQLRPLLDQWAKERKGAFPALLTIDAEATPASRVQATLNDIDLNLERPSPNELAQKAKQLLAGIREASNYRVMMVDDDPQVRIFVSAALKGNGMHVQAMESAEAALAHIADFKPDLLLLDLNLPGSSGLELTSELRSRSDSLILPIVFLSGDTTEQARFSALKVGGDDFLTKPISPRHLVTAIRTRIKRVRALAQLSQQSRAGQTQHRSDEAASTISAPSTKQMRRGEWLELLNELAAQPGAEPCALLVLTMDQSARLSEQLGLLAQSGVELALSARLSEVLGPRDRFAAIQPFVYGVVTRGRLQKEVAELAEQLRAVVADRSFSVARGERHLSLSVGVCQDAELQCDPDKWFNSANAAAQTARRLGGNRIEGVIADLPDGMSMEKAIQIRALVERPLKHGMMHFEYVPWIPLQGAAGIFELKAQLNDPRDPLRAIKREHYAPIAALQGSLLGIEQFCMQHLSKEMLKMRALGQRVRAMSRVSSGFLVALREAPSRELAPDDFLLLASVTELLRVDPRELDGVRQIGLELYAEFAEHELTLAIELRRLPLNGVIVPCALLEIPERIEALTGIRTLASERRWKFLVRGLSNNNMLRQLWQLGSDFAQGEALAPASLSMDFDFSEIAL
jgi:DNA-binding response OmpR family regulator/EAL domain-containing protein (putative c-di-GMP-specific phosphodiesterase class I)